MKNYLTSLFRQHAAARFFRNNAAALLLISCSAPDSDFESGRTFEATQKDPVENIAKPEEADATIAVAGASTHTTTVVRDRRSQVRDVFNFGVNKELSLTREVPEKDYVTYFCEQKIGDPLAELRSFAASSLRTSDEVVTRPSVVTRLTDTFPANTNSKKLVNIFVTVDNSELTMKDQIRLALKKLVSSVNTEGYQWKLFLGGLTGGSNNLTISNTLERSASYGDNTLPEELDEQLDLIFEKPGTGAERFFYSHFRLIYENRNEIDQFQDQTVGRNHLAGITDSMRLHFIIAAAPNCRDGNNAQSGSCNVGSVDGYHWMAQHMNINNYRKYNKYKSLFSVLYPYPESTGQQHCNAGEGEDPSAAADQFNNAINTWNQYGDLPSVFVRKGDICQVSEDSDLNWISGDLMNQVKEIMDHRFILGDRPADFVDASYDLTVSLSESFIHADNNADDRVLAFPFDKSMSAFTAVYSTESVRSQWERKTYYFARLNEFNPLGDSISVTTGTSLNSCTRLNNDPVSSIAAGACAFETNGNVHFGSHNDVAPGTAPSVSFMNSEARSSVLEWTSTSPIDKDSIAVTLDETKFAPDAYLVAKDLIANYTLTTSEDGLNGTLTFSAELPAGSYSWTYLTDEQYTQMCSLGDREIRPDDEVLCHIEGSTPQFDASGRLVVTEAEKTWQNCQYDSQSMEVTYGGKLPAGNKGLNLSYSAPVFPVRDIVLPFLPDKAIGSIQCSKGGEDMTMSLDAEYVMIENVLSLNENLMPGDSCRVDYAYFDYGSNRFRISSQAEEGYQYHLFYGCNGEEPVKLEQGFEFTKENEAAFVTVSKDLIKPECMMIVEYANLISVDESTESHTEK